MPDVSRAEYDAALTRVKGTGCAHPCNDSPDDPPVYCACRRVTLAALGLDEPPAEDASVDNGRICPKCGIVKPKREFRAGRHMTYVDCASCRDATPKACTWIEPTRGRFP